MLRHHETIGKFGCLPSLDQVQEALLLLDGQNHFHLSVKLTQEILSTNKFDYINMV